MPSVYSHEHLKGALVPSAQLLGLGDMCCLQSQRWSEWEIEAKAVGALDGARPLSTLDQSEPWLAVTSLEMPPEGSP